LPVRSCRCRRAVQQNAPGRLDAHAGEQLGLGERQLYRFHDLSDLVLQASDVLVAHARCLDDLHDAGAHVGGLLQYLDDGERVVDGDAGAQRQLPHDLVRRLGEHFLVIAMLA